MKKFSSKFMQISFLTMAIIMISGCSLIEATTPISPQQNTTDTSTPASILMSDTPVSTEITLLDTATPVPIDNPALESVPTTTPTFTPVPPTATPTQTPTPIVIVYPYNVQLGSPVYLTNFAHPDLGCNWMGVAGQVFNKHGDVVNNLVVEVYGKLGNQDILRLTLTGMTNTYGPGSYEIMLSSTPIPSKNTLFIHLYDLEGNLLTKPMPFETYGDCDKNLILINFNEGLMPGQGFYLPIILRNK